MGVSQGNVPSMRIVKSTNLIKTVKSFYMIENIFSLLTVNKKLEIILYNKKYQNKMNISIDYIKKISGKIMIGERNGYGEEFIIGTNIKIFEGNYLNGKKSGRGKEYGNNKIIFEGEYSKGKKCRE